MGIGLGYGLLIRVGNHTRNDDMKEFDVFLQQPLFRISPVCGMDGLQAWMGNGNGYKGLVGFTCIARAIVSVCCFLFRGSGEY